MKSFEYRCDEFGNLFIKGDFVLYEGSTSHLAVITVGWTINNNFTALDGSHNMDLSCAGVGSTLRHNGIYALSKKGTFQPSGVGVSANNTRYWTEDVDWHTGYIPTHSDMWELKD